MNINAVENTYSSIQSNTKTDAEKQSETKASEGTKKASGEAAVYEKSDTAKSAGSETSTKQIYKMDSKERASMVDQMKNEQQQRQQQLVDLVKKMMSKQGTAYATASGDDIWKFLASGNYKVDAETQAQAQADIAEDGYWGVKQTSERIFSFASALAGDDEEAMKKMQKAFEKGFRQATGAWGKELPGICGQTYDAVQDKFKDYFDSKKSASEE